jgi:solute carrier family 25 citrate transporter 1
MQSPIHLLTLLKLPINNLSNYFFFFYRFGAFEEFKKRSVDEKGNLSASKRLLCGLGAGVSEAILAVTPMETVKVKFINDQRSANPKFKGFFHGVRTIIKEEGMRYLSN